jgi:hypothetical protein
VHPISGDAFGPLELAGTEHIAADPPSGCAKESDDACLFNSD